MIEVEKKYLIDNPDEVKARLETSGQLLKKVKKEDFYFARFSNTNIPFVDDGDPEIGPDEVRVINQALGLDLNENNIYHFARIRIQDRKQTILTLKLRSTEHGLEQNIEDERDFSPLLFEAAKSVFLDQLNLTLFFTKTKDSTVFKLQGATIELVYVPEIDQWYIEAEYTVEESQRAIAAGKLDSMLSGLGFADSAPEARSYPRLIKDTLRRKFGDTTLAWMSEKNAARLRSLSLEK